MLATGTTRSLTLVAFQARAPISEVTLEGDNRRIDGLVSKLGEFVKTVEEGNDVFGESLQLLREGFDVDIFLQPRWRDLRGRFLLAPRAQMRVDQLLS